MAHFVVWLISKKKDFHQTLEPLCKKLLQMDLINIRIIWLKALILPPFLSSFHIHIV